MFEKEKKYIKYVNNSMLSMCTVLMFTPIIASLAYDASGFDETWIEVSLYATFYFLGLRYIGFLSKAAMPRGFSWDMLQKEDTALGVFARGNNLGYLFIFVCHIAGGWGVLYYVPDSYSWIQLLMLSFVSMYAGRIVLVTLLSIVGLHVGAEKFIALADEYSKSRA